MANFVQGFILNHTYQKDFNQITQYKGVVDALLNSIKQNKGHLEGWTAPRWANVGDIAFFMQANSTGQTIVKHLKTLYGMGVTNIPYNDFEGLLYMFCLNKKIDENTVAFNHWMIYPEAETGRVCARDYGFRETLLIEDAGLLKKIEGVDEYIIFNSHPEIAIPEKQYYKIKDYIFNHPNATRYFWTDFEMAIPVLRELDWNWDIYDKYGATIFAVGEVDTIPEIETSTKEKTHWRIPIYANYKNVTLLENPIMISDFRDYITISRQGTVTPVYGEAFEKLKSDLEKDNKLPESLQDAVASPITLAKINDTNWLEATSLYRRRFTLESQFRAFFVDRFLKAICPARSIYRECVCYNTKRNSRPRVDNVILIDGKYLPVEVKLNVKIERDIKRQCASYCGVEKCDLNHSKTIIGESMYQKVMVIDTTSIYLYDFLKDDIKDIKQLDDFASNEDLLAFKEYLREILK